MEAIEESAHRSSFDQEKSNISNIPLPPSTNDASSNGINVTVQGKQLENELDAAPTVSNKNVDTPEGNATEINNETTSNDIVENVVSENISENIAVEQEPTSVVTDQLNLKPPDPAQIVSPTESTQPLIVSNDMQIEVEIEGDNLESEIKEEGNNVSNDKTSEVSNSASAEDLDGTHNILSQMEGENIVDVLTSQADVNSGENNNGVMKQSQILNKEELLDILEGNDDVQIDKNISVNKLQSSLALQQFIELKKHRSRSNKINREKNFKTSPKRKFKKKLKDLSTNANVPQDIISDIVQDWNDDEMIEVVIDGSASFKKSEKGVDTTAPENSKSKQDSDVNDESNLDQHNDSQEPQDGHNESIKSIDSTNRRVGRVIKKKIIFDPDNPDTFTKTKNKNKDNVEKLQSSPKKIKVEQEAKAKSPVNKPTTWKKPHLKSKNQNKHRLTEVDRLLMDEGAVNMIYQLTPEASQGKKNMRTKAELIKKINQSSTPETKEKKFRERRKEPCKNEDQEGRKLSNKQRMSLGSSVKSPSGFDDFEGNSADDSIIYRRHSSSSYSSTCMSPRRLSDVEGSIIQNKLSLLHASTPTIQSKPEANNLSANESQSNVFMSGDADISSDDKIVKKACLNLKKKLNSTLPQALNFNMKRKGEGREEKPLKQRKSSRLTPEQIQTDANTKYEKLVVNIKNKVAEVVIKENACENNLFNIQTLKEMSEALTVINDMKTVVVTLILSENGHLCTGLDFSSLLTNDLKARKEAAIEIADFVRNLFKCLEEHSKILLCGVEGVCEGISLAIFSLCDVAIATDTTVFSWSSSTQQPLMPGLCVLSSTFSNIPKALVNSMVYTNSRYVGAAVTPRVVSWPTRVASDARTLATNMAANPTQIMKKHLMLQNRDAATKANFLKSLETERDTLTNHWCSNEGLELIKARFKSA